MERGTHLPSKLGSRGSAKPNPRAGRRDGQGKHLLLTSVSPLLFLGGKHSKRDHLWVRQAGVRRWRGSCRKARGGRVSTEAGREMSPGRGKVQGLAARRKKASKTTLKSKEGAACSPCRAWRAHPNPGIQGGTAALRHGCNPRHRGAASHMLTTRRGSPQPPSLPSTRGTKTNIT